LTLFDMTLLLIVKPGSGWQDPPTPLDSPEVLSPRSPAFPKKGRPAKRLNFQRKPELKKGRSAVPG
jgi:hypothetical protein